MLEPKQHERDPGPTQFGVHLGPVRHRTGARAAGLAWRTGRRPGRRRRARRAAARSARPPGRAQVIGHGGVGHLGRGGDLAQAQALAQAQPQDLSYLSHGNVGSGHRLLLGRRGGLSLQAVGDLSTHAIATQALLSPGCTKTPKRVYGLNRNRCTKTPKIRTVAGLRGALGGHTLAIHGVPARTTWSVAGGWHRSLSLRVPVAAAEGRYLLGEIDGEAEYRGRQQLTHQASSSFPTTRREAALHAGMVLSPAR